ncbi:MAG: DUF3788 domain-containing protein [Lachnospiraceae bacterium]
MLDIKDIAHQPDLDEISQYIANPLFDQFFQFMQEEYKALCKIEYSKDTWAQGWNVKLRKAGKGLCVIYPKQSCFTVLVVVGRKEKEQVEKLLPRLSKEMQALYEATKEGNGQRWLMIDLNAENELYQDTLKLIRIRRESK